MTGVQGLLPQFFPEWWRGQYGIVGMTFAEGVALGFVRRGRGGYSYLLKDDFRALGIQEAEMVSKALDNLAELNGRVALKIARPPGATVAWIDAEDNFAAVRLLLPEVKARLVKELGERLLFTIPSRDLCLCWNASAPPQLTEKHAREVIEAFDDEEYNLTPSVLVFTEQWPCPNFT